MKEIRVRFAPSPTGQVHIGNIRTAIFNYLFARHNNGEFLLRIEDTDRERSTDEAIAALFNSMEYLHLDYDGEVLYQSSQAQQHLAAARKLMEEEQAYYGAPSADSGKSPILFRIPLKTENFKSIRSVGGVEINLAPDQKLIVNNAGVNYYTLSSKGKATEQMGGLGGFRNMVAYDCDGVPLFNLESALSEILSGREYVVEGSCFMTFERKEVVYNDLIKGELTKPLDNMRDLVIVRADGTPVFHLANVVDDMKQEITHIVRGDDHVENTYRHVMLFEALGYDVPQYAHLPMIVNAQGKPYSKRDGDAFVGDFKTRGYLAEALFNYLALLGWSPGDDREKMDKKELATAFTLDRVKSAPAQFDVHKLTNLNGLYIAEMADDAFLAAVTPFAEKESWYAAADKERFAQVAALMQPRTKIFTQVDTWRYFFDGEYTFDAKNGPKHLTREDVRSALEQLRDYFAKMQNFSPEAVKQAIEEVEKTSGLGEYKLFQPARLAVTGVSGGPELDMVFSLIGRDECIRRIGRALEFFVQ